MYFKETLRRVVLGHSVELNVRKFMYFKGIESRYRR